MATYSNNRQNQESKKRTRIGFYFMGGGIGLLIIGLAYLFLYSPVFQIKKFIISGEEYHSDREIMGILEPLVLTTRFKNFIGSDNLFAWDIARPDVSKTALADAVIERDWLRQTVSMTVRERGRLAIWCDQAGACDWIDDTGMAFEEAPQTEGSLILTVYDAGTDSVIQGKRVLEDRFIANAVAIIKSLKEMRLPIKKITYDPGLQEIHAETYRGPSLFFSVRFDPAQNISSLHALAEKIDISKISHIDLRVENRIYYR